MTLTRCRIFCSTDLMVGSLLAHCSSTLTLSRRSRSTIAWVLVQVSVALLLAVRSRSLLGWVASAVEGNILPWDPRSPSWSDGQSLGASTALPTTFHRRPLLVLQERATVECFHCAKEDRFFCVREVGKRYIKHVRGPSCEPSTILPGRDLCLESLLAATGGRTSRGSCYSRSRNLTYRNGSVVCRENHKKPRSSGT